MKHIAAAKKALTVLLCAFALLGTVGAGRPAQAADKSEETLVVYFSRAAENYSVGVIEKGNTRIVAEIIAGRTGAGTFEIRPVKPYPAAYKECTDAAKREREAHARPPIAGSVDISRYKTVFIGYPIWWGDMPMPVYTFLESHDFSGKTIVPFCTHEGSGLSDTVSSIRDACPGATVRDGLAVRGSAAQRGSAKDDVLRWLEGMNF